MTEGEVELATLGKFNSSSHPIMYHINWNQL